jgi:hypothetical protein
VIRNLATAKRAQQQYKTAKKISGIAKVIPGIVKRIGAIRVQDAKGHTCMVKNAQF